MADSLYKDTEEACIVIKQLLEALEQLGDELASRKPSHLDFRVTIHQHLPSIKLLEEMINQISDDWKNHVQAENIKNNQRSQELSHAYEALQIKNDDILRDIEAARRIQIQLLPQQTDNYHRDELEFAALYQTKDKVGGDLYDLIRIGKNAYGLLIADVSGHGIPSALLTMFLKAAFRSYSRWGVGPDQICQEVNHVLHPIVSDLGFFATVFFGIVDLETSLFRYTNCGHPYALLHKQSTEEVQELGTNGGGILGPFHDVKFTQEELLLQNGDTILAFTDGIPEARDFLDQMFEEKRLSQAFVESFKKIDINHPIANQIIEQVIQALHVFTMGAPANDDRTLAVLRFHHKLL